MYFERYWTVVVCIIMIICLADLGRTIVPVNRRTPRPTVQLTTPYNFPHMLYNYRTLSETATSRIPSPIYKLTGPSKMAHYLFGRGLSHR